MGSAAELIDLALSLFAGRSHHYHRVGPGTYPFVFSKSNKFEIAAYGIGHQAVDLGIMVAVRIAATDKHPDSTVATHLPPARACRGAKGSGSSRASRIRVLTAASRQIARWVGLGT
jgi:hypothetical protein